MLGTDGWSKRRKIFRDTRNLCENTERLKADIENSNKNRVIYLESDPLPMPERKSDASEAELIVSRKRTLEAAGAYKGKKVCILNFASATVPGGGVLMGDSAQEEGLCRCSTLYFSLNTKECLENFYQPHIREKKTLGTDDCIYTPDITVLKEDNAKALLLPEDKWYQVNVISCAAPDLRMEVMINPGLLLKRKSAESIKVKNEDLGKIHEKRLCRILDIAKLHENQVVILGAFGCGAFYNPPGVVARAAKEVIKDYKNDFDVIEFAIYCSNENDRNYTTFRDILLG